MLTKKIINLSSKINEKIIKIRRELHRNPELSFQEFKTSALIKEYLSLLDIQIFDGIATTGVVGLLKCGESQKTFALRADMDALPVIEQNNFEYASITKGVMHACGHDIHIAMLLGVAEVLSTLRHQLHGNIKFIFQPGEEGYGGAKKMVDAGILKSPNVEAIVAAHVSPSLKTGQISVCSGPAMASPSKFKIKVQGRGGHAGQPAKCINPISIASNLIDLLNKIMPPRDNALDRGILTVTSFVSGNTHNVIPEEALIEGTVRTFNPSIDYKVFKQIEELTVTITKAMGASYKFFYEVGYPPVINDEIIAQHIANCSKKYLPEKDVITDPEPLMLAEDFAYYIQQIPGAIFNLGCAKEDDENPRNLHSNKFNPDENCIKIGIQLMSQIAIDFLAKK